MPQAIVSAGNKTKLVRSSAIRDDDYETDDNVINASTVDSSTVTTDIDKPTTTESITTTTTSSTFNQQKHYQNQYQRRSFHHHQPAAIVKVASDTREFRPPTALTSDQFVEFLCQVINKTARDQMFLLFIEKELVQFTKDTSQFEYHIEESLSYYRLLVHRCAELFGMEHNLIRNTNQMVLRKTSRTQIPDFAFGSFIRERFSVPLDSFQSNNFRSNNYSYKKTYSMDTNNNEKMSEVPKRVLLKRTSDGNSNGSSCNSSYEDNVVTKDKTYYEQQQQSPQQQQQQSIQETQQSIETNVCDNSNSIDFDSKNRNLSFEEREEQYDKARRRIFDSTTNDWVSNVEDTDWNDNCQVKLLKSQSITEETSTSKNNNYTNGTVSLLTRTSTTDSTSSASNNGVQTTSRLSPSTSSGYKSISQSQHSESYTPSPTTMISLEMSNNERTNSRSTNNDGSVFMRVNAADEDEDNWNNKIDEEREKFRNSLVPTTQQQQQQQPPPPLQQQQQQIPASESQLLQQYNNNNIDYGNYMIGLPKVDVIPPGSIIINPNTGMPFLNADGTIYHFDPTNIPEFLMPSVYSTRPPSYAIPSSQSSIPIYSHQLTEFGSNQKLISSNNTNNIPTQSQPTDTSAVTTNSYAYQDGQTTTTAINFDYNLQMPQQHYVPVPYYYTNDGSDLNTNALAYNYVPVQPQYLMQQNQIPLKDYQILNSGNIIDLSSQFAGMNLASQSGHVQQLPIISSDSPPLAQTTTTTTSIAQIPIATTAVKYSHVNVNASTNNQTPITYYYTQIPNQQQQQQQPLSNECVYVTTTSTTNTANINQDNTTNVPIQQQLYSIIPSQTNQSSLPIIQTPTTSTQQQPPQFVFYPRAQVPINYQQMITPNVLYNCASPIQLPTQQFATLINPYMQSLQTSKNKMYSYIHMPKTTHQSNAAAVAAAAAAAAATSAIQINQPSTFYNNRHNSSSTSSSSYNNNHGRGYNSRPGYRNTRSFHHYSSRQYRNTATCDIVTNTSSTPIYTENGNYYYRTSGGTEVGRVSKSSSNGRSAIQKFNNHSSTTTTTTYRHNGDNTNTINSVTSTSNETRGHDDNAAANSNTTADKRHN